jgi:hypothetical protein
VSDSSQGKFYDSDYTEAVFGCAYRPVYHDRLNAMLKYTYFYNVPPADQVTGNNSASDFIQRSHIGSVDVMYNRDFFDSRAHLYVLRADWHFIRSWDALFEVRKLDLPDAEDNRSGALVGLYRHLGDHIKVGVGYNFSDFSDDLTQLDYKQQGLFINVVGKI